MPSDSGTWLLEQPIVAASLSERWSNAFPIERAACEHRGHQTRSSQSIHFDLDCLQRWQPFRNPILRQPRLGSPTAIRLRVCCGRVLGLSNVAEAQKLASKTRQSQCNRSEDFRWKCFENVRHSHNRIGREGDRDVMEPQFPKGVSPTGTHVGAEQRELSR